MTTGIASRQQRIITEGEALAKWLLTLAHVGDFYRNHTAAPLPGDDDGLVRMNIRARGDTPEERLARLEIIADGLEVPVLPRGAMYVAERRIDSGILEAHVNPGSVIYVNPAGVAA